MLATLKSLTLTYCRGRRCISFPRDRAHNSLSLIKERDIIYQIDGNILPRVGGLSSSSRRTSRSVPSAVRWRMMAGGDAMAMRHAMSSTTFSRHFRYTSSRHTTSRHFGCSERMEPRDISDREPSRTLLSLDMHGMIWYYYECLIDDAAPYLRSSFNFRELRSLPFWLGDLSRWRAGR